MRRLQQGYSSKWSQGFTLVELMVTMVIAIILITVGVPSMKSMYEAYRSEGEVRRIQQSLLLTRNYAVSYGSRVTMCPTANAGCGTDWSAGYHIFIDGGTDNSIDGTDEVLQQFDAFNTSDFVTFDGNAISFTPDGLVAANSTSGTFVYCPGSKTSEESRGITISASGRIQFETGAVDCN
ncbi:GspH/FimT family pseudopilin [Shewanella waksmanii]|uniref:GspH/FimT family pseudopilin n=1 Tax=Shewanella waksmanii TaxID=213783 RepID=UPI000687DE13|nr:GspH/FimT family pseudopilin [Shewanella waksmanii]